MQVIVDLFNFITQRKQYWLAPVIIVLLLLGLILIFSANSALAPFIYTLF